MVEIKTMDQLKQIYNEKPILDFKKISLNNQKIKLSENIMLEKSYKKLELAIQDLDNTCKRVDKFVIHILEEDISKEELMVVEELEKLELLLNNKEISKKEYEKEYKFIKENNWYLEKLKLQLKEFKEKIR